MAGRRLSKSVRLKVRAGQKIAVKRGWSRSELPARPAGPCRRISPIDGTVIGTLIRVPAAKLKLNSRAPWRTQREASPC